MTWEQVPKELRAEVVRLAGQGRFHSDLQLARLAHAWAGPASRERTVGLWFAGAVTAVSGGPADMRKEFKERQQARVIVSLGDPDAEGLV